MTSREIRRQFIDFFAEKHGHTFVPSSPVVPLDDPTLLFTNAGMNQFKPIFLGQEKRAYTRAVNTQKCIRAGGKHNDLDDVGRSRRHGTFFEMLGNWSFGDYFKRGAIEMAWELLTRVWKMDTSRLHVTCFEGDEKNGVPRDTEAAALWKEIAGIPDERIHYFGAKDNFWEMGETGPCGPCTEINIDKRPLAEIEADRRAGRKAPVNGDDPRVMEFWNLVFIQYNRNPDRSLTPLPAQHVDTGMGFERICSILQGRDDMYGIDLFDPFFARIGELSGFKYGGSYPKGNTPDPSAEAADPQLRHDIAFRVIADHMRTLTFAITDGAVPSNEGRGYVLRRILRRAVRFGRQQLELREPFLHKIVPVIVDSMGDAFPELKQNPSRVVELIKDEEESFGRTLARGISLFNHSVEIAVLNALQRRHPELEVTAHSGPQNEYRADIRAIRNEPLRVWNINVKNGEVLGADGLDLGRFEVPAKTAFELHDTYGFPIDLTRIMAEERGMTVDIAGYEKLMEQAKEIARAGGKAEASKVGVLPPDALATLDREGVKQTDDSAKFSREPIGARVMAVWNGTNFDPSADTNEDQEVAVILDRTSFYAEMGGQVGDAGTLVTPAATFDVETTQIVGGFVLHIGRVRSGTLRTGDTITAAVGEARRVTEKNHTTTHLANWALREVLGNDVQQKGSLVDPHKLRFDFSHGKPMSEDELAAVEKHVNDQIGRNLKVYAEVAPLDDAMKINGLRAVFGEKYPPMVRVVSIGVPVADLLKDPSNAKWRDTSVEFCGGTHLGSSLEAEAFVLTSEESVSKGIRRIVALTGTAATASLDKGRALDESIARANQAPGERLGEVIRAIGAETNADGVPLRARRRAQRSITELQSRQKSWEKAQRPSASAIDVAKVAEGLLDKATEVGGAGKLLVGEVVGASDDQLRGVMDSLRKRALSHAIMLGATDGARVTFVSAVSDDLISRGLKAGDWIRETAKVAGGGGGGKPQMAQAGGKDPAKLAEALDTARKLAGSAVK